MNPICCPYCSFGCLHFQHSSRQGCLPLQQHRVSKDLDLHCKCESPGNSTGLPANCNPRSTSKDGLGSPGKMCDMSLGRKTMCPQSNSNSSTAHSSLTTWHGSTKPTTRLSAKGTHVQWPNSSGLQPKATASNLRAIIGSHQNRVKHDYSF